MKFAGTPFTEDLKIEEAPCWSDWFTPNGVGGFIESWCDNNNGGMVVYIKESENGISSKYDIKAKWVAGTEDCDEENPFSYLAYNEFLTARQYASLDTNKELADDEFMTAFEAMMKYFEIEIQ